MIGSEVLGLKKWQLQFAKALNRFLADKDGSANKIWVKCLKQKVALGSVLDEIPKRFGENIWDFDLKDVMLGTTDVTSKGSVHFIVPDYEDVASFYYRISKTKWRDTDLIKTISMSKL